MRPEDEGCYRHTAQGSLRPMRPTKEDMPVPVSVPPPTQRQSAFSTFRNDLGLGCLFRAGCELAPMQRTKEREDALMSLRGETSLPGFLGNNRPTRHVLSSATGSTTTTSTSQAKLLRPRHCLLRNRRRSSFGGTSDPPNTSAPPRPRWHMRTQPPRSPSKTTRRSAPSASSSMSPTPQLVQIKRELRQARMQAPSVEPIRPQSHTSAVHGDLKIAENSLELATRQPRLESAAQPRRTTINLQLGARTTKNACAHGHNEALPSPGGTRHGGAATRQTSCPPYLHVVGAAVRSWHDVPQSPLQRHDLALQPVPHVSMRAGVSAIVQAQTSTVYVNNAHGFKFESGVQRIRLGNKQQARLAHYRRLRMKVLHCESHPRKRVVELEPD